MKLLIAAGYIFTLLLPTVEAETALFGKLQIGFHGGTFRPGAGSFRDLERSAPLFGAAVGVPVRSNIDIRARASRAELSNVVNIMTLWDASIDVLIHTYARGPFRPGAFLGAALDHRKATFDPDAPFPQTASSAQPT